ncbi:helix-turn-helix domain-containing protein [filamentous cyanobacterium LEGE 11480]|uniref:Helix-turn-helix domain-containing protein n=1 Tax=Romeriopsis navalis LEGE 11480 TaxID=2777977 RepID=A0A928VHJ9_9CYAN|nr:helix-turn-helix domain-containing protein [Romeriopsis navalis]MBE9028470.1 helix-turn-helix domain-containing protein [Romeriopsis navalis LEGE 11480]
MFAEEFGVKGSDVASAVLASTAQDANSLTESLSSNLELLSTVETQLGQSPVYQRAVASLQQLTAEQGIDGQILLKAVSLEAVRLTLQVVKPQAPDQSEATDWSDATHASSEPAVMPVATDVADVSEITADAELPQSNLADDELLDNDVFTAIESVVHAESPTIPNPLASLLSRYQAKRQTAVEEVKVFTRAEMLTQIGAQIQLEREQKGLTIAQLHARTFIPMYHLQALEGGHVEQLPEDVYLRGFLRRIENALGLEVSSLIDKLPMDVDKSIVPCWSGHASKGSRRGFAGLDINPNHLYVTYAAIMAGGVCWLSNQTAPTAANLPDLSNYEPRAAVPAARQPKANLTANRKSASPSVKVGAAPNMAPPEVLR